VAGSNSVFAIVNSYPLHPRCLQQQGRQLRNRPGAFAWAHPLEDGGLESHA